MTPSGVSDLFLACGDLATDLIASDAVGAAWTADSALDGYTVGGLAGHLARAVLTVEGYLERPPAPARDLTDASGYLATVLGDHDPLDSDLHRAVRRRGDETAADGQAALLSALRDATARLRDRLDDDVLTRSIAVLDGVVLPVHEYLRTRLVELVVHLDDLAVSVGIGDLELPEEAMRAVAGVLAETAARRAGGLPTVRSLARAERHPDAVRAL